MTALRLYLSLVVLALTLAGCAATPDATERPQRDAQERPAYRVAEYRFQSARRMTETEAAQVAAVLRSRVDPMNTQTTTVQVVSPRRILVSALQPASSEPPSEALMRFLCETRGRLDLRPLEPVTPANLDAYSAAVDRLRAQGLGVGDAQAWFPIRTPSLFNLPLGDAATPVAATRAALDLGVGLAYVNEQWLVLANATDAMTADSRPPWRVLEAYVSHVDERGPVMALRFDISGVHRLRVLFDRRKGDRVGVFVDDELLGAPVIGDALNPLEFTTLVSKLEAEAWARIVSAPPLPVPLQLVSVSTRPAE